MNTIDFIVKEHCNTTYLALRVPADSDYEYFLAKGFDFFEYNSTSITKATNLLNYWESVEKVDVYGVSLPKATLTCEPLLLSIFTFEPDPLLNKLVYNVYLAHEARYNATGKFTAMSEGNTGLLQPPHYIYESTVTMDGDTWALWPENITPIAYFKIAVSFLALYNTSYTQQMVSYFEPKLLTYGGLFVPACGYMDGIDENGRMVESTTDKTNGLIIAAANYAITQINAFKAVPESSSSPTPTIIAPINSPTPTVNIPPANASESPQTPTYADHSDSYLTVLGIIFISGCLALSLLITIHSKRKAAKFSSKQFTS